jgi:hypothetical protein
MTPAAGWRSTLSEFALPPSCAAARRRVTRATPAEADATPVSTAAPGEQEHAVSNVEPQR